MRVIHPLPQPTSNPDSFSVCNKGGREGDGRWHSFLTDRMFPSFMRWEHHSIAKKTISMAL